MAAFLAAAKALKKGGSISSTEVNTENHPFNLDEIFKSDTERFGKLQDVIKYIFDAL